MANGSQHNGDFVPFRETNKGYVFLFDKLISLLEPNSIRMKFVVEEEADEDLACLACQHYKFLEVSPPNLSEVKPNL